MSETSAFLIQDENQKTVCYYTSKVRADRHIEKLPGYSVIQIPHGDNYASATNSSGGL